MDAILLSLTIVEDLSDEEYSDLIKNFQRFFINKGIKVNNVIRKEGTTEIDWILQNISDPETITIIAAYVTATTGITLIISKLLGIDYKKIFKRKTKKINNDFVNKKHNSKSKDIISFYDISSKSIENNITEFINEIKGFNYTPVELSIQPHEESTTRFIKAQKLTVKIYHKTGVKIIDYISFERWTKEIT